MFQIKSEGGRRNLERRGYSKRPKFIKESKYYICRCGAFGCTHLTGNINLKCKECTSDCILLFNAPKLANVFKCEDCNTEWKSTAIYQNWSKCRKCLKLVYPTKFFYGDLIEETTKISDIMRRRFVEWGDYGESFNLFSDELYNKILNIAKKVYC